MNLWESAGIRAGRSWIFGSAAVELSFTVSAGDQSAEVGERLTPLDQDRVVHGPSRPPHVGAGLHHAAGRV